MRWFQGFVDMRRVAGLDRERQGWARRGVHLHTRVVVTRFPAVGRVSCEGGPVCPGCMPLVRGDTPGSRGLRGLRGCGVWSKGQGWVGFGKISTYVMSLQEKVRKGVGQGVAGGQGVGGVRSRVAPNAGKWDVSVHAWLYVRCHLNP